MCEYKNNIALEAGKLVPTAFPFYVIIHQLALH
jgi:hypothetical protein